MAPERMPTLVMPTWIVDRKREGILVQFERRVSADAAILGEALQLGFA